jgi:hypothetical protein
VIALGRLTCRVPQGADGLAHYVGEWWDERHADLSRTDTEPLATDCIIGNTSVPLDALVAIGHITPIFHADLTRTWARGCRSMGCNISMFPRRRPTGGHQGIRRDNKGSRAGWRVGLGPLLPASPSIAPHPLGAYGEGPKRAAALRSCLLMMHIRPSSLRQVGKCIQGTRWEREWYRCVYGLCYWTGCDELFRAETCGNA